jgi:hypothetical protein
MAAQSKEQNISIAFGFRLLIEFTQNLIELVQSSIEEQEEQEEHNYQSRKRFVKNVRKGYYNKRINHSRIMASNNKKYIKNIRSRKKLNRLNDKTHTQDELIVTQSLCDCNDYLGYKLICSL